MGSRNVCVLAEKRDGESGVLCRIVVIIMRDRMIAMAREPCRRGLTMLSERVPPPYIFHSLWLSSFFRSPSLLLPLCVCARRLLSPFFFTQLGVRVCVRCTCREKRIVHLSLSLPPPLLSHLVPCFFFLSPSLSCWITSCVHVLGSLSFSHFEKLHSAHRPLFCTLFLFLFFLSL